MSEISTELIKQAVYKLCFDANTCLCEDVYSKILNAYKNAKGSEIKSVLKSILKNAEIAYTKKRPLCQDTGQVIVFIEIGQNVKITGELVETAINEAVEKCYKENFFRKSVVKNAVFDRTNTKTNTPVIIYTDLIMGNEINIKVLIKGAGSENKSKIEMLLPTSGEEDIISMCGEMILLAGENSCPPMFIGIGIGATSDKAMVMSKKAFPADNFTEDEKNLASKIKDYVNLKAPEKYGSTYLLDVKLMTSQTHIACMPVAVTVNCHSDRISSCTIKDNNIIYHHKVPEFEELSEEKENLPEIFAEDISAIRKLNQGDEILLTGEIYVARDMAHKRIMDLINNKDTLPFDIKDKIIFYAGPCPAKEGEVIGSIGPTTASRMDKYAKEFYDAGMLASIGKGDRSKEVEQAIIKNNAKYFTVTGGIAALLADKVKKNTLIAFEDLGTEAVYRIFVEKLPLKVAIG